MFCFVLEVVDLPVQGLQQKQNQSFESTPQGSHTGTPSQTDDVQPGESPEASNSKHSRRQPFRTEEKKGTVNKLVIVKT